MNYHRNKVAPSADNSKLCNNDHTLAKEKMGSNQESKKEKNITTKKENIVAQKTNNTGLTQNEKGLYMKMDRKEKKVAKQDNSAEADDNNGIVEKSTSKNSNSNLDGTYTNIRHLNFGEIDSGYDDLFDCVKNLGMTILASDDYSKYVISVDDEVKVFDDEDDMFDYYADFLESKGVLSYSRDFFRAMISCTIEESDDALYDYGLDSVGTVNISDGYSIDEDLDGQLFCIIQQGNEDIKIIENIIYCDGENIPASNLGELLGYIPSSLEIYNCVFVNFDD